MPLTTAFVSTSLPGSQRIKLTERLNNHLYGLRLIDANFVGWNDNVSARTVAETNFPLAKGLALSFIPIMETLIGQVEAHGAPEDEDLAILLTNLRQWAESLKVNFDLQP